MSPVPVGVATDNEAARFVYPSQFAVLLQIAEQGCADAATLAAIVPGADQGDLMESVEDLLDCGLLQGRAEPLGLLDNLVAHGWLLNINGSRWLDADVA